jgi:phosphoserine phosphatase
MFDMDGVLTEEVSGWKAIHRYFGVDNTQILNDYWNGKIDYEEFMRRDIGLWPSKIRISQIEKILSKVKLVPGVRETIKNLRSKGYQKIGVVSAGLDILANKIGHELSLDYIIANGLKVDKQGFLTGEGICRVELLKKDKVLIDLAEKIGVPLSEFIAIGDSKYDISMLKIVGFAIAFNPKDEEIKKVADVIVEGNDLRKILNYL